MGRKSSQFLKGVPIHDSRLGESRLTTAIPIPTTHDHDWSGTLNKYPSIGQIRDLRVRSSFHGTNILDRHGKNILDRWMDGPSRKKYFGQIWRY